MKSLYVYNCKNKQDDNGIILKQGSYSKMKHKQKTKAMLFVSCLVSITVFAGQTSELICDGPHDGTQLSQQAIDELLQPPLSHQSLNFCGAIFDKVSLSNKVLANANFTNSIIRHSDLSYSDLTSSTFTGATITDSNMTNSFAPWSRFDHVTVLNSNLANANFNNSQLNNSTFKNTNLEAVEAKEVNFKDSVIQFSNLSQANFSHALMDKVDLRLSKLFKTDFSYSSLVNADLSEIDAVNVNFTNAILSGGYFYKSKLKAANFTNSHLDKVDFMEADLLHAIYKPNLSGLPLISSLATARNFNTIDFYDEQLQGLPLTALRNAYQKNGMRKMERLITSMVKTAQMQHTLKSDGLKKLSAALSYVLFYLTCEYGLNPTRPLLILLMLLFLFSVPYRYALLRGKNKSGIYLIWPQHQKRQYVGDNICQIPLNRLNHFRRWQNKLHLEWVQWQRAFYFSLLSSFRIGWEDFNVSNWINQIQTKEFKLQGYGLVKSLAGIQALVSIYLVLLWILTYFGRPFEW